MVIISASRRTDIPAFHSEWFMGRVREGYVMVRNPVAHDVVYRIDLRPQNVDCLSFITKDPRPMERYIDELMESYDLLFQVTITPYGKDIEPNVPDVDVIIDSFIRISKMIGKGHMLWRYDPVIIDDEHDIVYHMNSFKHISDRLKGYTSRCIFSFLSMYDRIAHLEGMRPVPSNERISFIKAVKDIAIDNGMELTSCCVEPELKELGLMNRGCIDRRLLIEQNIPFDDGMSNNRDGCLCVRNIDIGTYDTCMHDCIYCYANSSNRIRRSSKGYDVDSESLCDVLKDGDRIVDIGKNRNCRLSDF